VVPEVVAALDEDRQAVGTGGEGHLVQVAEEPRRGPPIPVVRRGVELKGVIMSAVLVLIALILAVVASIGVSGGRVHLGWASLVFFYASLLVGPARSLF